MKIDVNRKKYADATGIYVRVKNEDGKFDSRDIAELDKESLKEFMRSRGGENEWAESIVYILLEHER